MLNIQPANITFGQRRRLTPEEIQAIKEEREYQRNYDELYEQREDFIDLANDSEFKVPKSAKKVLEGGAIITTGLLGGMATGWGTKKSIDGFAKLSKTQAVKNAKDYFSEVGKFAKKSSKSIKKEFVESDVYKIPAKFIKKNYDKFAATKFGKPISKFLSNLKEGINNLLIDINKGFKYIYKKITGIDKKKAEKVTINTVGVSGGIASGATAIKEKQEAGEN